MRNRLLEPFVIACTIALSQPALAQQHEEEQRVANLSLVGVDDHRTPNTRDTFELIQVMPDPIEGFNRGSFAFTKGVVDWVLHPMARGWRFITPRPVRKGVENFAYNLGFPGRFVSLLLQGEVVDAGQETAHFAVNTTAGLAGVLDVAEPLGIPTHRADVGLSFARWGFGPGFYFVIPLLGPSSGRDALGRIFDTALAPTTYVPGVGWLFSVNSLGERIDVYDALEQSHLDFYALVRGIWGLRRHIDATHYAIPAEAYASSDPEPSLGVLAFRPTDPDFATQAVDVSAVSPRTQRAVPFSVWLRPEQAPIVYLIPGIGAQRRSSNAVALAELAYRNGYSVAVVSSPFHPEFIETGLSSTYPGFTPEDASDLLAALSALDTQLRREHPDGLLDARLLGYSLGAIEALFVADLERAAGSDALHFTHVMAINSPVDLRYSAEGFDLFYDAPLQWPESERRGRLVELAMKALLVAQDKDAARKPLPVDRIESEFLIGLSGRATVVEALSAIERRGGSDFQITPDVAAEQGRAAAELNASSLANYADRLAVPYFSESKGLDRDALLAGASLRSREASLRADPRIRALTNENDFILGPENLAWLRGVLGPRLTVFPDGGHLGNLSRADVQSAILEGLGTPTDAAVMPCPENSAVAGGPRVDGAGEIERCIDGGDVRELQLHE